MTAPKLEPAPSNKACIIEETRAVRVFISNALAPLGLGAWGFESGSTGLSALLAAMPEALPALVICESRFRDIDGRFLLQRLRKNPLTARLPLLVLSSARDPETRQSVLRAGADEFVPKPCRPEYLQAKVRLLLANEAALARAKEPGRRTLLLLDEDPFSMESLRAELVEEGYLVLCAGNAEAALRLLEEDPQLVLADLEEQNVRPATFVKLLQKRAPVWIFFRAESLDEAWRTRLRAAGVREFLQKSIRAQELFQKIERLLQYAPPPHLIEIEAPWPVRLSQAARPFPPTVGGNFSLSMETLVELFSENPELDVGRTFLSGASVRLREEPSAEPLLKEGRTIRSDALKTIRARLAEQPENVLGAGEEPVRFLTVRRNPDCGKYLYEKRPFGIDRIRAAIESDPLAQRLLVLDGTPEEAETTKVMAGLFDFLDLLFFAYEFQAEPKQALLKHSLTVALLLVRLGIETLRGVPDADPARRRAFLTILGLAGFLHDMGLVDPAMPAPDSERHFKVYAAHAELGFERLRESRLFEAVKCMVRDHHKDLSHWTSRFDSCTRLLQLANDCHNLVRPYGFLARGRELEPSPDPYTVEEACLILRDRARLGCYRRLEAQLLLKVLQGEGAAVMEQEG
ncbi:MAG: response regulator [Planctomycetota bacterium]